MAPRPAVVASRDGSARQATGPLRQALFGLRPVGSTSFDSERTGLAHVSLAVASRELDSAAAARTEAGIKHGEITDLIDAGLAIPSSRTRTTATSS